MSTSTTEPDENRRWTILAAAAIFLLGILGYVNTFDGEFVWDDASSILLHQHVKDASKIGQLFLEDQHAFAGGEGNFYRPLLSVTFAFDYLISTIGQPHADPARVPKHLSPLFFHMTSATWHVAAALFLLALMTRLGAPAPLRIIVPVLYVIHPLHTEAVAYISGRADSMSATFIFAGLFFASASRSQRQQNVGLALSVVCFAAGLLSKESTFIFPALLALTIALKPATESTHDDTSRLRRWLPLIAALVVLGIYAALRTTLLSFASDSTPPDSTFLERIIEVFQALALYGGLILMPVGLHMERTLDGVASYTVLIGIGLFVACLAAIAFSLKKKQPRAALGLAWFLITWLPISGIFPLNAPMAEHWMYVPLAGLLWGISELVFARVEPALQTGHRSPAIILTVAVMAWAALLTVLTIERNRDWHDNESLYQATLRENPNSTRVHFNLAVTYEDLLGNRAGAKRHYQAVVDAYTRKKRDNPEQQDQLWRDELESHLSLGDLYVDEMRFNEAFSHYQIILTAEPTTQNVPLIGSAAFGVGRCFLAAGDLQNARQQLDRAAAMLPHLRPEIERLLYASAPL